MGREIIFDIESTGLDAGGADRIVEIGCVELVDLVPTGRKKHSYFDPQRQMPREAFAVHGLSGEFLSGKPLFADKVDKILAFFGDDPLVAHNGNFDFGFLNAELARLKRPPLNNRLIDTLALAQAKHPGANHTLNGLCRRYGINTSARTKHSALLDAELLAQVYIELVDERQRSLDLTLPADAGIVPIVTQKKREPPLVSRLTADDIAAHRAFIATSGIKEPIWGDYVEIGQQRKAA